MRFLLIAFLFVLSGCGFLDDNLFLDDEAYEGELAIETLEFEEMLIIGLGSGGYSSCSSRSGTYGYGRAYLSAHSGVSSSTGEEKGKGYEKSKRGMGSPREEDLQGGSWSNFVDLVNSYGAKKHELERHLP